MKQVIQSAVAIITLVLSVQTAVAFSGSYQEWTKIVFNEIDTNSNAFAYADYSKTVRKLVNKRLYEASSFLEQYSRDPSLWYLKGWLTRKQLYIYIVDARKAGIFDLSRDKAAQVLQDEYQSYYQKAMDLDENPDAPEHLTAMMVSNIGTDTVGDPAIKARALEKLAALARAGEDGSDNPTMVEWNTYEARVGIYVDAKDYANALKIVNEMLERFPNTRTDELLNWKQNMESKVKQQKQQAAAQDAYAQADTYTAPKAAPVQQPVKAVEPKQAEAPKATKETPELENNPMLWWLLGGGIGLLGVIGLLMGRKKG